MENLEILKGVVSDETYAKIEAETKDSQIKLADLSKGEYVLAGRVTGLEAQLEKVNAALTAKTAEYDALKEKAGDNQSLKDEIENLKAAHTAEIGELKTQYDEQLKKSAVVSAITSKYRPKDVADILPHVDMAKVTVDKDTVIGLSEQLDPLKENKPYLFEVDNNGGNNGGGSRRSGLNHGDNGDKYDEAALRAAFGIKEEQKKE